MNPSAHSVRSPVTSEAQAQPASKPERLQSLDAYRGAIRTHLGRGVFEVFGAAYGPIVQNLSVLLVFWLILWWMYRKQLFIRI